MLTTDQRIDRYHAQNGSDTRLTAPQQRRIRQKPEASAGRQERSAARAKDRAKRAALRTPRISR